MVEEFNLDSKAECVQLRPNLALTEAAPFDVVERAFHRLSSTRYVDEWIIVIIVFILRE